MIPPNFLLFLSVHDGSQSTFSRVFELDHTDLSDQQDLTTLLTSGSKPSGSSGQGQGKFPVNVGITGYVATTGETVNILDAYQDSR